MVSVSTHEMDSRQLKFLLTQGAFFLIETLGTSLQLYHFCLHFVDSFHVFLHLLIILLNHFVLVLKSVQQIFLQNFEFYRWLVLDDFKNEQRTQDLFFAYVVKSLF